MLGWHIAAVAIAASVMGFAGGWKTQGWRWSAADAERLASEQREALRRMDKADNAAVGYERARAQTQERIRYVTREVDRIVEQPLYRDGVCLDDGGLRLIAEALANRGASQPPAVVPGASAAR